MMQEAQLYTDPTAVVDIEWQHGISARFLRGVGQHGARRFAKMSARSLMNQLDRWGWWDTNEADRFC